MGEGAVGGAAAVAIILGLLVWLVKRLVNGHLHNMSANTDAVRENTDATRDLAGLFSEDRKIRDERERSLFKQLDRIESNTRRGHRGEKGTDRV